VGKQRHLPIVLIAGRSVCLFVLLKSYRFTTVKKILNEHNLFVLTAFVVVFLIYEFL